MADINCAALVYIENQQLLLVKVRELENIIYQVAKLNQVKNRSMLRFVKLMKN